MNPQDILKDQFLKIVDNQLQANNPPETQRTFDRLLQEGYNEQDAKHLIAACVAHEISEVMITQQPFDEGRYSHNLRQLPRLPEELDT